MATSDLKCVMTNGTLFVDGVRKECPRSSRLTPDPTGISLRHRTCGTWCPLCLLQDERKAVAIYCGCEPVWYRIESGEIEAGGGEDQVVSECCGAKIDGSRADGVLVGSCSKCNRNVVRVNPRTGRQKWLDGRSPWDPSDDLRPVENSGGSK